MGKYGIVRRIDDLGRVVIPKEIRQKLDIKEGDPLEMTLEGNKICFELYDSSDDYEDKISRLIENLTKEEHSIPNKKTVISALEIAKELLGSDNNAE